MQQANKNFLKVKLYDYKHFLNMPIIHPNVENFITESDTPLQHYIKFINNNYSTYSQTAKGNGFITKIKNKVVKILFNYSRKQIEFNNNVKNIILDFHHNIREINNKNSKLQYENEMLKMKVSELNDRITQLENKSI